MSLLSSTKARLVARLPQPRQIVSCFAVIVFVTYSWTCLAFLWKLSSWVSFLPLAEIIGIFAYSLVTDLLSSLIVLAVLLVLAILLPPSFLRNQFAARGSAAVGVFSLWLIG